jgi:hypothetical protein
MPDDRRVFSRPYYYPALGQEPPVAEPKPKGSARQQAEALLAAAAAEEARVAKAEQLRIEAVKVRAKQSLADARAYRAEVDQAVEAAAALNAKASPPLPLYFRVAARNLLHGARGPYFPAFGAGQQDQMLDVLVPLRDKGQWLHDRLPDLDEAGRLEIDQAEILCHQAVLERARVVAGEV